jgi:peptidoglycan/xylan/chitin deacetylase (PgdA/CDA1 family)
MKAFIFSALITLLTTSLPVSAAVILQYHHVSDTTAQSTSIGIMQFKAHLQFLKDNGFTVVALNQLIEPLKKGQPIADKLVAITFDDAYQDIYDNARPLLNEFAFPYTIFVNPQLVQLSSSDFMSWQQLNELGAEGVITANHGLVHESWITQPETLTPQQWHEQLLNELHHAEKVIKENTGQSWHYFAYPYGEYSAIYQQLLEDNDFVGLTQQSGALGQSTDLTAIPRFPVSAPYDQLAALIDKLYALPFSMAKSTQRTANILNHQQGQTIEFSLEVEDFAVDQLNCFVSGIGKQEVIWLDQHSFTLDLTQPLPIGRVRSNCTAPSKSQKGRFYWYSKPWFVRKADGSWYPY